MYILVGNIYFIFVTILVLHSTAYMNLFLFQAAGAGAFFSFILNSICNQLYSPLRNLMSFNGLLCVYSSVLFLSVPFTYFFVVETAGQDIG